MMPTDSSSTSALPSSFQPGINEVIIGRGKRIAEHCGNKRLHQLVKNFVKEYAAAPTKRQKSAILSRVVSLVRNNSAYQAGFVKQSQLTGEWRIVEDAAARITVAQAFRDALHIHYKSSKQFKQQKRQDKKGSMYRQPSSDGMTPSLLNSLGACSPSNSLPQRDITAGLGLGPADASSSFSPSPSQASSHIQSTGGFSALFRILEETIDLTNDPFEPTPIPDQRSILRPPSFVSSVSLSSPMAKEEQDLSACKLPSAAFVPNYGLCFAAPAAELTAV